VRHSFRSRWPRWTGGRLRLHAGLISLSGGSAVEEIQTVDSAGSEWACAWPTPCWGAAGAVWPASTSTGAKSPARQFPGYGLRSLS
jgi:hypothetical protein